MSDLEQSFWKRRRRPPRRPSPARVVLATLLAGTLGACSDRNDARPAPPPDPPSAADHIALNQAWLIGTHNAYWVDRGFSNDLFSSGVQESLLDQIVADGARAIELDVHPDDDRPHRFRVHHTTPGNTLCADLADCLRPLRLFHAAFPRHEPLHVVVELKKFTGPSFDDLHTVDDLEAVLEESLGDWLYRPRDLLAQCDPDGADPDPDLAACLARTGWPTVAALRGRVLVIVLGNFDDLLPQAKGTLDWARFTLHGDLRQRSTFSMASSWKLDWDALPEKIRLELSRADLARALRRVVFLQVESPDDPNLAPFLAGNGMVRMGGADSLDDQRERIALGAQILQGDTPWIAVEDRGPAQPVRPLDASLGEIVEPGDRIELSAPARGEAFARRDVGTRAASRWEALPSVGAESDAVPCLVAASTDDAPVDSVALCRDKVRAPRTRGAPLGSGDPDAEKLRLRLRVCRAGVCAWSDVRPDGAPSGAPGIATLVEQAEIGVLIALEVAPRDGGSCAQALVATDLDPSGTPVWHPLGDATCSVEPLTQQGLLAIGGEAPGAVLFGGTRLVIDGRETEAGTLAGLDLRS